MNSTLISGTIVVTCALVAYSIFFFKEQRRHALNLTIMTALTIGICLDFSATILMIIGARRIPITPHGFLGYSALGGMLIDTILTWRHWSGEGKLQPVSRRLQRYTRVAYGWWVLAYIAGGMLAAFEIS